MKGKTVTNGKINRFNWRAFISIMTGLSFIAMSVSGVILFVVPPGRIANWTGWTIFGLTKDQWAGLHIWFSVVFMLAAVLHIYFNWRPLVDYFKNRVSKTFALRTEWLSSLLLCIVIGIGTLLGIRPFSSLLAWNEQIKYSWDKTERRAPVPHAELMTLAELAGHLGDIDVETMMANLKAKGIDGESPESVVGELAEAHGMTPRQLYDIAVGQTRSGRGRGGAGAGQRGGQGMGRLTLKEYCAEAGLSLDATIEKLQEAGFKATGQMTIREIGDAASVHPSEVRRLLE
jgi:hypothetical protein